MRGDVLQHHNRVIDHQTDGDGYRRQRNDIQRITRSQQVYKGRYQGDWHHKGDDDGGAPSSQEEEHHNDHQQQDDEDGFLQTVDSVGDVVGVIDQHVQFHVGRQGTLNVWQFLQHFLTDLHRVGTSLLLDDDHGATFTVGVGLLHTFLQGVAHHSHVPQIDVFVGVAANHHVFHLIRAVELAIHAH